MRNAPNVYLSALALVAIPNIIGNYLGPLIFAVAAALRLKQDTRESPPYNIKADSCCRHG
jgi:hypothetical protein